MSLFISCRIPEFQLQCQPRFRSGRPDQRIIERISCYRNDNRDKEQVLSIITVRQAATTVKAGDVGARSMLGYVGYVIDRWLMGPRFFQELRQHN